MLSRELERQLAKAAQYSKDNRHEFVTLEHILLALTAAPPAVEILQYCGATIPALRQELQEHIRRNTPVLTMDQIKNLGGTDEWNPEFTLACHRVLQRSAMQVQSSGKTEIREGNILVSLFYEKKSFACYAMQKQGISQFDVINAISHKLDNYFETSKSDNGNHDNIDIDGHPKDNSKDSSKENEKKSPLEMFCVNLVQKAEQGKTDPLIGRDDVIERLIQILSRRTKNNPLIIGEPGVGKTAIADGLALKIAKKEVPESLQGAQLYSLDLGILLAGSKFRGDFESRIKSVIQSLKSRPKSILFIDEIHTLVGAGATGGGSMDASNLLKPALADGSISCIGSTTHAEYRQHFEKDRALNRRFQRIDLSEPNIEQSIEILKGLKSHYENFHQVKYSDEALAAAAKLSAKFIQGRHLPDKAIDVMDEAGARAKLKTPPETEIGVQQIEEIVAFIAQVPATSISANDKKQLKDLDKNLKALIYGQDEAIDRLTASIKLARSGLRANEKPIGCYLFAGPTGVGKTEVCKQLARLLGVKFLRFDMSEYAEKHTVSRLVGAPPGYVGYEEGGLLTEAINKSPYAVVLLDELEKAHPDIYNILLQIMDAGRLTDSNGRTANFSHTIIVMTTNAGAQEAAKGFIGLGKPELSSKSMEAVKRLFTPEFLNRLDAQVPFQSLPEDVLLMIVEKFLGELAEQLAARGVKLETSLQTKQWLLKKGFDPAYGARPLARAIDEWIKKPLVDELLFGKLSEGGNVRIEVVNDQLKSHFNEKEEKY